MAIDAPHPPAVTIVMPDVCQTGQAETRFRISKTAFLVPPIERPKGKLNKGKAREEFYYKLVVRGVKLCDEAGLQITQDWHE